MTKKTKSFPADQKEQISAMEAMLPDISKIHPVALCPGTKIHPVAPGPDKEPRGKLLRIS